MAISKQDRIIIPHLRRDARISLTNLSRQTGVPVSTAYEHLKKLRRDGVLSPISLLDFAQLGFHTRILVALKVDVPLREKLEEYLSRNPHTNSLYRIDNGYSLMLDGIFRNMRESEDFMEELESEFRIHRRAIFYVLGDLKREVFLSDPVIGGVALSNQSP
jgi:DNA-binding Lrp family transcriptional regulator